ncbi:hypothetical protein B0H11DRAFT_1995460 [Mycena galericulata]|nr:hypothetical protein B0H11DRAFT_1995460 [Mycena galericulata]
MLRRRALPRATLWPSRALALRGGRPSLSRHRLRKRRQSKMTRTLRCSMQSPMHRAPGGGPGGVGGRVYGPGE